MKRRDVVGPGLLAAALSMMGAPVRGSAPWTPQRESADKRRTKLRRRRQGRRSKRATAARCRAPLYPPRQGSRRPEWSSAVPGQWSPINGAASA